MYYSPLRLIDLNPEEYPTGIKRSDMLLARKKLLAELELGDGHSTVVSGKVLTRKDIITTFDELNNDELLRYHQAIFSDKALLRFLETGEMGKGTTWNKNSLYADVLFIAFISPYFAEAQNKLLTSIIKNDSDVAVYSTLLKNQLLLLPVHWDAAYFYVRRFYMEKKSQLLVFSHRIKTAPAFAIDSSKLVKPEDINDWCSTSLLALLNMLPGEFNDLRFGLAIELNNLCVMADKYSKFQIAYVALLKAELIDTEEGMKQLIKKNLAVIYNKLSPGSPIIEKMRAETKKTEFKTLVKDTGLETQKNTNVKKRNAIIFACAVIAYLVLRALLVGTLNSIF